MCNKKITMRKNIFVSVVLSLFSVSSAFAQLGDNGYYRVQNNATRRYVGIIHNTSQSEIITTQADLNALCAYKDWGWVESDPATVIYIEKKNSGVTNGKTYYGCNLHGQGTDTRNIISHDIRIVDIGGNRYRCYVEYNGTQYLSEKTASSSAAVNDLNINNRSTYNWNIIPVSSNSSCYFGVRPTVTADGKYYATMFADWGFSPATASTKVYYVDRIWNGHAVIREIEGAVPASTPVLFECNSKNPVDNKLDIAKNNAKLPSENALIGVYFCIDNGQSFHKDFVAYDPATMRILGTCSDGRPGFVKKSVSDFTVPDDFWTFMAEGAIPANTAYLVVPEGTPDELPLISYEDYVVAGINGVEADKSSFVSDVITLSGVVVKRNATTVNDLPAGIYIWNKRKVVVK